MTQPIRGYSRGERGKHGYFIPRRRWPNRLTTMEKQKDPTGMQSGVKLIGRPEMKSGLLISSILLVLSGLILSACGTSSAQSNAVADGRETEYCIDSRTGAKMSYQQAVGVAQNSECIDQGQLKESHFCNSDTGTWWIELEIERPGCAPACVVDVNAKAAEINWRCTGLIPPAETGETVEIPESVQAARDSALDYLMTL